MRAAWWPIRGDGCRCHHYPRPRHRGLCLIGACILDGATIGKYGFVGAGAVVGPDRTVGEAELWLGNPACFAHKLSDKEIESLHYSSGHYVRLKDRYVTGQP